jgi:phosphoribosylaminoimidazole-succinocarboxamide synthase
MANEETNLHMHILRYAVDNPEFTHADLKNEFSLSDKQMVFVGQEIRDGSPFFTFVSSGNGKGNEFMLSFEGRSRLLEYEELKEARENAHEARRLALAALIVSGIGVLIEIFL